MMRLGNGLFGIGRPAARKPVRAVARGGKRITRGHDPNESIIGDACQGVYIAPDKTQSKFAGHIVNGVCQNVDGQACGANSIYFNGVCTPVPDDGAFADDAIGPGAQKVYAKWVNDTFDLQNAVLMAFGAAGITTDDGIKWDKKQAGSNIMFNETQRAAMLAQIKSGHAPRLFLNDLNRKIPATEYGNEVGQIPTEIIRIAARDGVIPAAASAALDDQVGHLVTKVMQSALAKRAAKAAPSNPFAPQSSAKRPPRPNPNAPTGAASVPSWFSPTSTIASANAALNTDMQNAINTGNMLDSVLAAGGGGAWNTASASIPNSDSAPSNQPPPWIAAPPPQQPGSGSQFVPPPPPDYSHMTGLGTQDEDWGKILLWFGGATALYCLLRKG